MKRQARLDQCDRVFFALREQVKEGLTAGGGGPSGELQSRLAACRDSGWRLREGSKP